MMKKLFTLVALLACFLGAKAEWVEDYSIDYSKNTGFPFYVMGYVPEWVDGVMTDYGANYKYVEKKEDSEETSDVTVTTQNGVEYYKIGPLAEPAWHQYFIADGIPTEVDGSYTVKAMVKASEAVTINVNMGWGWGNGEQKSASVAIGTEWAEVEWEYSGIGGTSCNLVAQPGGSTATIEWKSVVVSHNQKEQRPTTWQEWLTKDGKPVVVNGPVSNIANWMGNAETPWADPETRFNDQEKNFLICAWGKEKGVNMNDDGGWDPFPARIVADPADEKNHVFLVDAQPATTEGDPSAWDNQFWIESPRAWKEGEQLKIHFRYKASQNVKTNTQVHKQNPSDYQHWQAIGDINFTTEWQEFDQVVAWPNGAGDVAWSIAFNLNPEVKDAVKFYFDDLSWQSMVLDEGYYVAGCNTTTGTEYDLDNAIEFKDEDGILVATVGEKNAYVNEIMISTVRGNDAAFKSNTLKPTGSIKSDPDEWMDFTASSLAKLKLPGEGIWKIYIDLEYNSMAFEMIEGTIVDPVDVVTNKTAIVVKGQERDWKPAKDDGTAQDGEEGIGTGQPWDNQFFLVANREFEAGEVTVLKFKYKASVEAKTSTQCHGAPGAYIHWAAIGDVNFTTEWQEFSQEFTIPAECAGKGMKSIAFNMAEIKGVCDYEITDVQWFLKYDEDGKTMENLINGTGSANFYVKEGAGDTPHEFGGGDGIKSAVNKNNKNNSDAIYNLSGQRVSKDYKGIVIKNGNKYIAK